MKKLMIATSLIFSGSVLAGQACDKPKDSFDGLYSRQIGQC